MKKLLSLIVVAVLVLSILPMGAMAEAAQKALENPRTQTIEKPTEGVRAPEENKAPEKPVYREESTLYSFGFETDPEAEGWTFFDLDGNGTNWAQSTTKKHSGDYSLMSSSYKPNAHNVNNWALTPAIELPATGMAALKFWIAQHGSSFPETWALYIGEAADPEQMQVLQADTTEGDTNFEQKEYDISEYLGKTVYIAFVNHNCYDRYYIYIDDVEIIADPEGAPITPTPAPTEVPASYYADALNAEDTELELAFVSGGTYPWIVMTDEADRVYAMSGNKGVHNSSSTVTATFTLDGAYQLSFDYMAWGEGTSYDNCIFKLDGAQIFSKGAENQPWQNYVVETPLEAGEHTIEFTFTKDSSANGSGDYFKVDNVKLADASNITPTPAPTEVPASYYDDAMNAADTELTIHFESTGDYPWIVMTDEADRVYAMSGNKGVHNSTSMVTATFTLDGAYQLSFDYMAWGEGASYDKCIFSLDGTVIFTKGAENQPWQNYVVETPLEAGEHIIGFAFTKDSSDNGTGDYFKVDNVKLADASNITPTPAPTETPIPTAVPEDMVGYYFESQEEADEWLFVDNDGDGKNWTWRTQDSSHPAYEGTGLIYSASYDGGALNPDNWAISPGIKVNGADSTVSLYMGPRPSSSYISEHVAVYIATGVELENYTPVDEFTFSAGGYNHYEYSLGDYVGETVYLAIRHYNCTDQYWMMLDKVEFFGVEEMGAAPTPEPTPTPEPPSPTPEPTETPVPTPVPEDLIVGYYFESEEELEGWNFIGTEDTNWVHSFVNPGNYDYAQYAHEGSGFILSYSFVDYVGSYQADNWAITPPFKVPENSARVSFYATNANATYPEAFDLYIGTSDDTAEMTLIEADLAATGGSEDEWTLFEYDLSEYAGETIYLAFYDHCYDMYELWIDQVQFWGEYDEIVPIEEIKVIGMTEPVFGKVPDCEAEPESSDAPYDVIFVNWYCNGELMESDAVFDDPTAEYHAEILLMAGIDDEFAEDSTIYVNGSEENIISAEASYSSLLIKWGYFTVEPKILIEDINVIGMTEPVFGEAPDYEAEPANSADPYTVSLVEWYRGDELMEEGELFDNAEAEYYAIIYLQANEGYEFAEVPAVLVSGSVEFVVESAPFNENAAFGIVWGYFTVEQKTIIDEISIIGMTEPVLGEAPDCEAEPEVSDAPYTVIFVNWYCNGELMDSEAVFNDPTAEYHAEILLMAGLNDEFAEDSTIYVNGSEENIIGAEAIYSSLLIKWGYFTVEPIEIIDTVEVNELDIPEWGANPDFDVVIPEGAPYGIKMLYWCIFDEETDDTVALDAGYEFNDPNAEYYVFIMVEPAEGYKFDEENVTALLNGGEMEILEYAVEDGMLMILAGPFTVEAPIVWGDANGDGETTIEDALLIMRYLIGIDEITEENLEWCDVNGDGSIDLTDALLIMRKVMGTIEAFPIED